MPQSSREAISAQAIEVDRALAQVSSGFKFLLAVTPINAESEWIRFSENGFSTPPRFQYRPLETEPMLLKRKLMHIRVDEVHDIALAHLFRQSRDELDRQIAMLSDLHTKRFLQGSIQVFGGVKPSLLGLARRLLNFPDESEEPDTLTANQFAAKAKSEIGYYKNQVSGFNAEAVVREDMYSGLLVTGGNLLIGPETQVTKSRADALLQHEVGTHLVTYYNGQCQPLRLLKVGLAGYDALQEGLAVLSEYLFGGLSVGRLRTLAARVVAVDAMLHGETFIKTFRLLADRYGLEPKSAFTVTLRVYRGGGITIDAVYLRGLMQVLEYLAKGGELLPLFVGKIAFDHVPIVQDLLEREILKPPRYRPRCLDDPAAIERLEKLRAGTTVDQLL